MLLGIVVGAYSSPANDITVEPYEGLDMEMKERLSRWIG